MSPGELGPSTPKGSAVGAIRWRVVPQHDILKSEGGGRSSPEGSESAAMGRHGRDSLADEPSGSWCPRRGPAAVRALEV